MEKRSRPSSEMQIERSPRRLKDGRQFSRPARQQVERIGQNVIRALPVHVEDANRGDVHAVRPTDFPQVHHQGVVGHDLHHHEQLA